VINRAVRHRRNPQPCVLCKDEQTYDWDHICSACRLAWKQGVECSKASPPEGTHEVIIAWYWKLYEFAGVARRHREFQEQAKARFRRAVMKLVGAVQISDKWSPKQIGAVGLPPSKGHHTGPVSRYIIVGDEETEQAMRDLYEAACDLMAEAYQDGKRRGKSFITDLAEGKMTAKDLERL